MAASFRDSLLGDDPKVVTTQSGHGQLGGEPPRQPVNWGENPPGNTITLFVEEDVNRSSN
eukprot:6003695-Pyramimonas_sp.AAC.1